MYAVILLFVVCQHTILEFSRFYFVCVRKVYNIPPLRLQCVSSRNCLIDSSVGHQAIPYPRQFFNLKGAYKSSNKSGTSHAE